MSSRIYGCTLLLLGTACSTADVRPKGLPEIASESNRAEGRAWLDRAFAAQGESRLQGKRALRIVLRDKWNDEASRVVASPWDEDAQQVQVDVELDTENVKLTFLEGENTGEVWGLQQWVTYRKLASGEEEWDSVENPDETLWFWLPRFAFFALPVRDLREAPHVQFAGVQNRGFRDHAVVYAAWSEEPTDEAEQYVIWIDHETERIRFIDHTLRTVGSSLTTTLAFADYEPVEGFSLPRTISELGSNGRAIHRISVEYASFLDNLPSDYFVPKPDRRAERSAGL